VFWVCGSWSWVTRVTSELTDGSCRHGSPQAWASGALAFPGKCCEVFLCISSYSKALSRRIIYALFSHHIVGFWGFAPYPHRAPSSTRWHKMSSAFVPILGKHPAGADACRSRLTFLAVWSRKKLLVLRVLTESDPLQNSEQCNKIKL